MLTHLKALFSKCAYNSKGFNDTTNIRIYIFGLAWFELGVGGCGEGWVRV